MSLHPAWGNISDVLPIAEAAGRAGELSPSWRAAIIRAASDSRALADSSLTDARPSRSRAGELRVEAFPGYMRIKGRKLGAESLNLYVRLKSATLPEWKLLAARRSKFPFDDDSPLAAAGTPETREYRAISVVDDEEIGHPSDIVSVLYGG